MGVVLSESNVHQDTDAVFRQLFSQYGENVYKSLLDRCGDEGLARAMLKDIFKRVYESLGDKEHVDVTSLWLNSLVESELMSKRMLPPAHTDRGFTPGAPVQASAPFTPPAPPAPPEAYQTQTATTVTPARQAKSAAKKGILGRLGAKAKKAGKADSKGVTPSRIAAMAALGVFILFLLWCIIGLLMDIQAIPQINFGYDWFNSHIFELF